MRYLNKYIQYVEGESFQLVHTGLHLSEHLTVCLVQSTSAFLKVFCFLKSEQVLALYVILSLFLLGLTEIIAAAEDQVFTCDWSMCCPSVAK